jgi:CheY-like chemotaxis protein
MAVVLVVDDHVGIAQVVEKLAQMAGCETAVTHTGESALAYVRAHPVDLVVLDVAMPGLSGLDVLRELRTEGRLPALPVLMFSASDQHRDESLRLGAVGFVLKHEADELPTLMERYACARRHP